MSTSYAGRLIVGVLMSELYKSEIRTKEATKYNADTGEPYNVNVKRLYATFGNKELPVLVKKIDVYTPFGTHSRESVWQDFDFLKPLGVEVYCPSEDFSNPEYVTEKGIVGIELCAGGRDAVGQVSIQRIQDAISIVRKALSNFGYTGDVQVYIQLTWG